MALPYCTEDNVKRIISEMGAGGGSQPVVTSVEIPSQLVTGTSMRPATDEEVEFVNKAYNANELTFTLDGVGQSRMRVCGGMHIEDNDTLGIYVAAGLVTSGSQLGYIITLTKSPEGTYIRVQANLG